MATLGTLRNAVGRKMGMDLTSGGNDEILLDEWANQGVIDVLLRTHCAVLCADLAVTAGTWKYELPSGVLAIKNVFRDGATGLTYHVSPEEILERRRTNSPASSDDDATTLTYAFMGANFLLLYPTPSEAYNLDVFYVPAPSNSMSSSSHDPSSVSYGRVPTELHKGIEHYMLWQAGQYQEDPRSQAGQLHRQTYEEWILRQARPALNRKGGSQLPRARTKRAAWAGSSPNDMYPRL